MPDDICIEPATQTGIGGKHDDSHTLHFTFHNERRLHLTIRTQKIGQDVIQGSMFSMAACALCNLAEATIFIAEVIFRVLFTEAILPFTSFSDAMTIRSL